MGMKIIFEIEFLFTRKDRIQNEEIHLKIEVTPIDEKMRQSLNKI